MELLVWVELLGLICHLGEASECYVKCWQSCPLLQRRSCLSCGIMWAEKEVFHEQNQHGRREEEVFKGFTAPLKDVEVCQHGGRSHAHGGTLLGAASSWDFHGLGFSVCWYSLVSLVSEAPGDSWPHCISLLVFLIWGPRVIAEPGYSRWDKKSIQEKNEIKVRPVSAWVCVCVFLRSLEGLLLVGPREFSISFSSNEIPNGADSSWCVSSTHCMPGTVASSLYTLTHLNLTIALWLLLLLFPFYAEKNWGTKELVNFSKVIYR